MNIGLAPAMQSAVVSTAVLGAVAVAFFYVVAGSFTSRTRHQPTELGRWFAAWGGSCAILASGRYVHLLHQQPDHYFYQLALVLAGVVPVAFAAGFLWRKVRPLKAIDPTEPREEPAPQSTSTSGKPSKRTPTLSMPAAVLLGAGLIAAAVLFSTGSPTNLPAASSPPLAGSPTNLPAVSASPLSTPKRQGVFQLIECQQCEEWKNKKSDTKMTACRPYPGDGQQLFLIVDADKSDVRFRYYKPDGSFSSRAIPEDSKCDFDSAESFSCSASRRTVNSMFALTSSESYSLSQKRLISQIESITQGSNLNTGGWDTYRSGKTSLNCTAASARLPN